jgi:hypothetical protein
MSAGSARYVPAIIVHRFARLAIPPRSGAPLRVDELQPGAINDAACAIAAHLYDLPQEVPDGVERRRDDGSRGLRPREDRARCVS